MEWQDLEIGAIIHFGPNTFMGREWGDGEADPKVFSPTQFDPEQWMRALQSGGIRYVIFVAKHHDGFCLWPTGQSDYSVKSSPWENGQGDVEAVEEAVRKYGLQFGIYLSPWDRHEPRYANNAEYDRYCVGTDRYPGVPAIRYGEPLGGCELSGVLAVIYWRILACRGLRTLRLR